MWMSYDPDSDSAYILLTDGHPGEAAVTLIDVAAAQTEPPPAPIEAALCRLTLEFDRGGRLIAIEVEEASGVLPEAFLKQAGRTRGPRPQATSK
jgi:uncharacterized protein YuzE